MSLSARTFVLSENIPVANQVLPAFDREGVAVTYYIKVIRYFDDGIVQVVGNNDAFALFPLTDQFLHTFYIDRSYVGERLVENLEIRLAVQHKEHLRDSGLSSGEFSEHLPLKRVEFRVKPHELIVIHAI